MKNKRGGNSNNQINFEEPGIVLSPRTRRAGEKLLSARKTKRLQREFKKTQRALNTRSHRMGNTLKLNSSNLLGNQFKFFVNSNLIDETGGIIISDPGDSASGSVVMLFKSKKTDHQYILKVTGLIREDVLNVVRPMNFPELECEIYKEVTKLVKKNITPHTFTLLNNSLNIRRSKLPINNFFLMEGLNINIYYLSVLLNETSSANSNLETLSDFIKVDLQNSEVHNRSKIMYNILFQIIYTLEVFNRVGIMHNDLHTGNIFIVMNNNCFNKPNYRKTFKHYRFKSSDGTQFSVKLENIGFDVRIYDYDRSYKFAKPRTQFPSVKSTNLMTTVFSNINQSHTVQNSYFDTFKILCHLYNHYVRYLPRDFLDKIADFFYSQTLLKNGVVGTKDYLFSEEMRRYKKISKIAQLREYFLLNDQPIGHMMTTEEILMDLVKDPTVIQQLSGTDIQVPVIETYDMDGINVDLHARDKRIAKIKEFSRMPGKPISRRVSMGRPIRNTVRRPIRNTVRRPRRQSVTLLNARKNKKRKGNVNSNLLRSSELEIGSNNVFKSNSWVDVDEFGRVVNNQNNREDLESQERLERGAERFYFRPQPDNNNPFV